MKYFILLTGLMFMGYLLGMTKKKDINMDFMSRDFTVVIKGISMLSIVWAHGGARLEIGGIQFLGTVGVVLFIICSGYGLEYSYQRKGLKDFWKKRFLNVAVPFWIIELIGLIIIGDFTISVYLKDFIFIEPATAYGWFMGYILICYIFFWVAKKARQKWNLSDKQEMAILMILFILLFIYESTIAVDADMPFLKARQMLSFPCGIVIAKSRNRIERLIKHFRLPIIIGGCFIGLLFMGITQLGTVKAMPYILSNILSLLTCFPLAIAALTTVYSLPSLFRNRFLEWFGNISYEVYLVHAFALAILEKSVVNVIMFAVVTVGLSIILHEIIKKRGPKNG